MIKAYPFLTKIIKLNKIRSRMMILTIRLINSVGKSERESLISFLIKKKFKSK